MAKLNGISDAGIKRLERTAQANEPMSSDVEDVRWEMAKDASRDLDTARTKLSRLFYGLEEWEQANGQQGEFSAISDQKFILEKLDDLQWEVNKLVSHIDHLFI